MTALDRIHQQAQSNLRDGVSSTVARMLGQITLDRAPEVRDAYAAATARVMNAGQWQAAKLAETYIGTLASPVRTVDLAGALAERVVEADDGRAVGGLLRMWHLLDEGVDEDEARAQAGSFAGDMAATSLQGASRDGLDEAAAAADREPRWRLEPNAGACEWCQFIADTGARYLSAESVPVPHSPGGAHPGGVCGCSPAPDFEGEGLDYEPDEFETWAEDAGIPVDEIPQGYLNRLEFMHETYGDRFVVEGWNREVEAATRDLARIPDAVHRDVADFLARGPDTAGIYVGPGSVPDLDHLAHLRDVAPRGWPEGSTWADVSGAYSPANRAVVIGTRGGSGSGSLALHEYGHLYDDALRGVLGVDASSTSAFRTTYARVVDLAQGWMNPYYTQAGAAGPQELFAEAHARYRLARPLDRLYELTTSREAAQALASYFDSLP